MAESPTPFAEIDHGPSKLDQFLDAHQKKLIIAAILLAIGVIAYVIYSGIAKGESEDAGSALLAAEKVTDYQEVIKKWPNSKSATTALPLMADLQGADAPKEAIQTLKDFLDSNSDHPAAATAKVSLALRQLEQGNTEDAITLLTEVSETDSDSYIAPLAYLILGDVAKAAGNKADATTWYEKAKEDPTKQGNTFSDTASARIALVNALPPTKIKPAPPAPAVPPAAPAVKPAPNADPTAKPTEKPPVKPPVQPPVKPADPTPTPTPAPAPAPAPNDKKAATPEAP